MDPKFMVVRERIFLLATDDPGEIQHLFVVTAGDRGQLHGFPAVGVDIFCSSPGNGHDGGAFKGLNLNGHLRAADHELPAAITVYLGGGNTDKGKTFREFQDGGTVVLEFPKSLSYFVEKEGDLLRLTLEKNDYGGFPPARRYASFPE